MEMQSTSTLLALFLLTCFSSLLVSGEDESGVLCKRDTNTNCDSIPTDDMTTNNSNLMCNEDMNGGNNTNCLNNTYNYLDIKGLQQESNVTKSAPSTTDSESDIVYPDQVTETNTYDSVTQEPTVFAIIVEEYVIDIGQTSTPLVPSTGKVGHSVVKRSPVRDIINDDDYDYDDLPTDDITTEGNNLNATNKVEVSNTSSENSTTIDNEGREGEDLISGNQTTNGTATSMNIVNNGHEIPWYMSWLYGSILPVDAMPEINNNSQGMGGNTTEPSLVTELTESAPGAEPDGSLFLSTNEANNTQDANYTTNKSSFNNDTKIDNQETTVPNNISESTTVLIPTTESSKFRTLNKRAIDKIKTKNPGNVNGTDEKEYMTSTMNPSMMNEYMASTMGPNMMNEYIYEEEMLPEFVTQGNHTYDEMYYVLFSNNMNSSDFEFNQSDEIMPLMLFESYNITSNGSETDVIIPFWPIVKDVRNSNGSEDIINFPFLDIGFENPAIVSLKSKLNNDNNTSTMEGEVLSGSNESQDKNLTANNMGDKK